MDVATLYHRVTDTVSVCLHADMAASMQLVQFVGIVTSVHAFWQCASALGQRSNI